MECSLSSYLLPFPVTHRQACNSVESAGILSDARINEGFSVSLDSISNIRSENGDLVEDALNVRGT